MSGPEKRPGISVAHSEADGRMHAPAAERNAAVIETLLKTHAPKKGAALELASGTGQHVARFAAALPGLTWQPSEVDASRLESIRIWSAQSRQSNIQEPVMLDATQPGWGRQHDGQMLVLVVNLLHLIKTAAARVVITEMGKALLPGGRAILYGPFLRNGVATSDGDQRFHASIQAQMPGAGYKNDIHVIGWLQEAGLAHVVVEDMPANNLALIAERPI